MSGFVILNNRCYGLRDSAGKMRTACVVPLAVIIALLGSLLLVVVYRDQWIATKHGLVLVDKYVQSPRWSKDGRTLFYIQVREPKATLWAYDIDTGKKRSYDMPGGNGIDYDVSPDGKSVVYLRYSRRHGHDEPGLGILSLDTDRARTIYASHKEIGAVYWLPGSVGIVFQPKSSSILMTDSNGRAIKEMRNKHIALGYVAYGPGIIYVSKDRRYRYHNLETGEDRSLQMHGITADNASTTFHYLSDRCLAYSAINWTDKEWPISDIELLDIRSGCSKRIKGAFSEEYGVHAISPDMSRYWLCTPGRGEWTVPKLYVGTFPQRVRKEFAKFGRVNSAGHPF